MDGPMPSKDTRIELRYKHTMERDDFPVSSTATEQIRLVEDIMQ
jgi:hypothetical protein